MGFRSAPRVPIASTRQRFSAGINRCDYLFEAPIYLIYIYLHIFNAEGVTLVSQPHCIVLRRWTFYIALHYANLYCHHLGIHPLKFWYLDNVCYFL